MKNRFSLAAGLALATAAGCAHAPTSDPGLAKPAVLALQEGRFTEASEQARTVIAKDRKNASARAVLALTRYKASGEQAIFDGGALLEQAFRGRPEEMTKLRQVVVDFETALGRVDEDLAVATLDRSFSMELCLACWKIDWNHNGRLDRRDERLFQIEQDGDGKAYEDEDPRRKPTFRFDVGDLHWARAMVAFQRAVVDLLLVYWSNDFDPKQLRGDRWSLPVREKARSEAAKQRLLEALDQSDASRQAYLAETDDDREWVPSPRQKSHPMPLPIDDKLYKTWADLVGDVRRMLKGEEGLDVGAVMRLVEQRPDRPMPSGFINLGAWLSRPADLDFNPSVLDHAVKDPNTALRALFGAAFVPTMKASPIVSHLSRMTDEMKRGEESFERKLRYLFWVN